MVKQFTNIVSKMWTGLPKFYCFHRRTTGILAALDALQRKSFIAEQYKAQEYASVNYLLNRQHIFDVNTANGNRILNFATGPDDDTESALPEITWTGNTGVVLVNAENFHYTLEDKKHAMVMFFAPWCTRCKLTKPEFVAAAKEFKDNTDVIFAAVDCVEDETMCKDFDILGYPTIMHFRYGKKGKDYIGPKTRDGFIQYINKAIETT